MLLSLGIYGLIFIFGLILGSYLNSWMWRVHEHKWVLFGRSVCVNCARPLSWYENIPLFSYLLLSGKCRSCHEPIPKTYFWVELSTAILFVFTAYLTLQKQALPAEIFRNLFFAALLIVIFVYDAKYQLVLTSVVWVGAIVGFFVNIKYLSFDPYSLVIGGAIGGGFFLAQYLISNGRWIGGGDVRIGVMMGLWLGLKGVLTALFIAYITGAIFGLILIALHKKEKSSAIPFGTFLSIGTYLTIFWGEKLVAWYLSLFGFVRL